MPFSSVYEPPMTFSPTSGVSRAASATAER